jgi:hypothetical protein
MLPPKLKEKLHPSRQKNQGKAESLKVLAVPDGLAFVRNYFSALSRPFCMAFPFWQITFLSMEITLPVPSLFHV